MKLEKRILLISIFLCTVILILTGCSLLDSEDRQIQTTIDNEITDNNEVSENNENTEIIESNLINERPPQRMYISGNNFSTLASMENIVRKDRGTASFVNNRIRIRAEINVPKSIFEELAREHNAEITSYRECDSWGDTYTFTFVETFAYEELRELAEAFEMLDIIKEARLDIRGGGAAPRPSTMQLPNDTRWDSWEEYNPTDNNWGLKAINAPMAWEYREDMQNVRVLVLDSSFYRNHEDLDFLYNRFDFYQEVPPFQPTHGTHVAGIIGAEFDNGLGISGVAPNSHMFGIQASSVNDDGELIERVDYSELMDIVENHIVYGDVNVINYSMGYDLLEFAYTRGNTDAQEELDRLTLYFERRLLRLIREGYEFVFVQSAGNQYGIRFIADENEEYGYRFAEEGEEDEAIYGVQRILSPFARIQNEEVRNRIIIVGAVDNQYDLAWFSQRGDLMTVSAPGVDIYSTHSVRERIFPLPNDDNEVHVYRRLSGASQAAPFVSGLATMLFGVNPNLTGEQVRQIIIETSNEQHNMKINAGEAVRVAIEMKDVGQAVVEGAEVTTPEVETQPTTEAIPEAEIQPIPENLYDEIREAYMEFLRQRGFESYLEYNSWGESAIATEYEIIDINNDGIPILIVNSPESTGWYTSLVFSYDTGQRRIVYVTTIYYNAGLRYSQEHNALAFSSVRGGGLGFYTLNDLINGTQSFSVRGSSVHGEPFFYSNGVTRDITDAEAQGYFNELRWIDFLPIPNSEISDTGEGSLTTPSYSSLENMILGEWHDRRGEIWHFMAGGMFRGSANGHHVSGRYSISSDNTLEIVIIMRVGGNDYLSYTWVGNENVSGYEWFITEDNLYIGTADILYRR